MYQRDYFFTLDYIEPGKQNGICICHPMLSYNSKVHSTKSLKLLDISNNTSNYINLQPSLHSLMFKNNQKLNENFEQFQDFLESTQYFGNLKQEMDCCIPLPGLDSKNSAFSYNALIEKQQGIISDDTGGSHLVGSSLLWKEDIDLDRGTCLPYNTDGSVVSVNGTGYVSGYSNMGPRYGNSNKKHFSGLTPNHAIKICSSNIFNIPNSYYYSEEHNVGFLASTGRCYHNGIFGKTKEIINQPKRFKNSGFYFDKNMDYNSFLSSICDDGVVAGAYIIFKTFNDNKVLSSNKTNKTNHSFIYIIDKFKCACESYNIFSLLDYILNTNNNYVKNFRSVFANKAYEGVSDKTLVELYEKYKNLIGGLLLQPTQSLLNTQYTTLGWYNNYVQEQIWANTSKHNDFFTRNQIFLGMLKNNVYDIFYKHCHIPLGYSKNTIQNFNSHTTGLSLQQHTKYQSDIRYMVKENNNNVVDFYKTQAHGVENYHINNSLINLPNDMPMTNIRLLRFPPRYVNNTNCQNELNMLYNQYSLLEKKIYVKNHKKNMYIKIKNVENTQDVIEYYLPKYKNYQENFNSRYKQNNEEYFYNNGLIRMSGPVLEYFIQQFSLRNHGYINYPISINKESMIIQQSLFSQHMTFYKKFSIGQYKYLSQGFLFDGQSLNNYITLPVADDKKHYSKIDFLIFGKYISNHNYTDNYNLEPSYKFPQSCCDFRTMLCKNSPNKDFDNIRKYIESYKLSRSTRMTPYLLQRKIPLFSPKVYNKLARFFINFDNKNYKDDQLCSNYYGALDSISTFNLNSISTNNYMFARRCNSNLIASDDKK